MGNILFYTHTKEDLRRAVKMVLEELRKTEYIQETSLNPEDDRLTQQEAAKFLGISVTSLISWKKKKNRALLSDRSIHILLKKGIA